MLVSVDDKFDPVTHEDVTDEKLVAGELRAFRVEVRAYFERLLLRLDRFDDRITSLEMHRVDANARLGRGEARIDDHESRIAALEAAINKET